MSLIGDKEQLIQKSYDDIIEEMKNIQENVYKVIIQFLLKHQNQKPTKKQLLTINKLLADHLSKTNFNDPVRRYLKSFDQVEDIAKKIVGNEIGTDLSAMNISVEKQMMVDEILNGILSEDMINANLKQPLRKMLFRYTTTNITMQQIEQELQSFILADRSKLGFAEKFVREIASEALWQFDGMINQKIATEYELDGFRFIGSLIVTSEPQCVQMINGTGELGEMRINGKYASKDLPKIIKKLKSNYKGVAKDLNESNYYTKRNHWGCRHSIIPTRLLERDKKVWQEKNDPVATLLESQSN